MTETQQKHVEKAWIVKARHKLGGPDRFQTLFRGIGCEVAAKYEADEWNSEYAHFAYEAVHVEIREL